MSVTSRCTPYYFTLSLFFNSAFSHSSYKLIIKPLTDCVDISVRVDVNDEIVARGRSPIIHLIYFISTIWLVRSRWHSCSLLIINLSNSHSLPLMHSMRTHCTYVQFDFGLVRLALLLEPHTLALVSREPAYSELYPHLLVSPHLCFIHRVQVDHLSPVLPPPSTTMSGKKISSFLCMSLSLCESQHVTVVLQMLQ